jgi:hypothetical protein
MVTSSKKCAILGGAAPANPQSMQKQGSLTILVTIINNQVVSSMESNVLPALQ